MGQKENLIAISLYLYFSPDFATIKMYLKRHIQYVVLSGKYLKKNHNEWDRGSI